MMWKYDPNKTNITVSIISRSITPEFCFKIFIILYFIYLLNNYKFQNTIFNKQHIYFYKPRYYDTFYVYTNWIVRI
jgi:hypothetical protein